MRSPSSINEKISEIREANARRKRSGRRASPERLDIIEGLEHVLAEGKYGTLHDWERKKRELRELERVFEHSLPKYWRRGMYGEIVPGDKLESIAWRLAAYSWALGIKDPEELKLIVSEFIKRKLKKKQGQ